MKLTEYIRQDNVKQSVEEVLKNKAPQFIASVSSLVSQNEGLKLAEPASIMRACLTAASLDLPINQNLGFAYIIAYKDHKTGLTYAQFQMGWRGFVQLAMRSGQFQGINVTDVRVGEMGKNDRLTGKIEFEFFPDDERSKLPIAGYVAYFKLVNGFEKIHYMSMDEIKKHGTKYSKSYAKGFGPWKDDFDSMARKTVLKLLLAKFAPMTVEMNTATLADQSIIKEDGEVYIDNQPLTHDEVSNDKETKRVTNHIEKAKTIEELEQVAELAEEYELRDIYSARYEELTNDKK